MKAVSVSGLAGVGKSTLAKELAKRLNFEYFSVGKWFRKKAEEAGLSIEEFMKIAPRELHIEIDNHVKVLAEKGRVVLDGRLTGFMAGKNAFKIFLTAPVEIRAKRVAEREGIPLEKAINIVKMRDSQDEKNYRQIYGIDIKDLSVYDLVLNNEFFGIEDEIGIIERIVRLALKI